MSYPKITCDTQKCAKGRLMKIIDDGPWWDGGVYWKHADDASPCGGEDCDLKVPDTISKGTKGKDKR